MLIEFIDDAIDVNTKKRNLITNPFYIKNTVTSHKQWSHKVIFRTLYKIIEISSESKKYYFFSKEINKKQICKIIIQYLYYKYIILI